jgi:hypothetical protein
MAFATRQLCGVDIQTVKKITLTVSAANEGTSTKRSLRYSKGTVSSVNCCFSNVACPEATPHRKLAGQAP